VFKCPTASRFASSSTLGAENPDQRLKGLLANLRWLSTAHASYPRKITKKLSFYRFSSFSVEIIEEKIR